MVSKEGTKLVPTLTFLMTHEVSKALSALNAVQLLAYDELDTITIMKVVSAIR